MSKKFFLFNNHIKTNCLNFISELECKDKKPCEITIKEATRKVIQNDKMWAMLTDISKQVEWYGQHLSSEEWKDVLSASLFDEIMVPAINSRKMVLLGRSTSKFSVSKMTDMIEFMYAFGAEQQVRWSE